MKNKQNDTLLEQSNIEWFIIC